LYLKYVHVRPYGHLAKDVRSIFVQNAPRTGVNRHNHSGRTVTFSTGGDVRLSRTLLG